MDKRIADWLDWGRLERRWARSTCDGYRRRVSSWLVWCAVNSIRQDRASADDVRAWLATLHPTAAVRSHAHTALLAWFDHRVQVCGDKRNPVRDVSRVPVRRVIPRSLSVDEVQAVLAAANNYGPRWSCFMRLMLFGGLRRAEACSLRWVDIEGTDAWLRVLGKGGQERMLPIHPRLRRSIVALRSDLLDPVWLFPGRDGGPMSVATATKWTRVILDAAGLPHATGHWCRHSFATRLIEQGVDVPAVQAALGHASLGSTTIYTRARPHRVAEAVALLDY